MPPWGKPPDEEELKRMLARHRAEESFVQKAREFATPIFVILAIVVFVLVGLFLDHLAEINCAAKGGEYHRQDRGSLCLSPGSVVK